MKYTAVVIVYSNMIYITYTTYVRNMTWLYLLSCNG